MSRAPSSARASAGADAVHAPSTTLLAAAADAESSRVIDDAFVDNYGRVYQPSRKALVGRDPCVTAAPDACFVVSPASPAVVPPESAIAPRNGSVGAC